MSAELALKNLNNALNKIGQQDLCELLNELYESALPYFKKADHINPIYHNTQVLENMVDILIGEDVQNTEFKRATILALLHDIGNAHSIKKKVKNSEIEDALINAPGSVDKLVANAMAFRLEHMDKGVEIARNILQRLIDNDELNDIDVHLICRAIAIHDYPSIEKSLSKINVAHFKPGDFLLPFDNTPFGRLITYLREADRLFMVTEQGVEKDLKDSNKDKVYTSLDKDSKLKSNVNSHKKEYTLYVKAKRDDGKFIEESLYRTNSGYKLFKQFASKKF